MDKVTRYWGNELHREGSRDNYKRVVRPEIPANVGVRGRKSPVVKIDKHGNVIGRYGSVSEAAQDAGVKQSTMSYRIRDNIASGGYRWRFEHAYKTPGE